MLKRFAVDRRGGVAMTFAIALVPLLALVGAAVDYSRAAQARTALQAAVDAAALAAAKTALDQNRGDTNRTARDVFDASFRRTDGTTVDRFHLTQTPNALTIDARARVPMSFANFVGMGKADVAATAQVPLGKTVLEVALVLDNTGSMAWLGKMDALKQAAKNLVDTLSALGNSNVSIAVVPFNTQVQVGDTNRSATWLRFAPGGSEPKLDVTMAAWTGCVADRDQPYDTKDSLPGSRPETLYPAAICQYPGLVPVSPLSSDFAATKALIDRMTPTGNTNTGIGLAWGLAALTQGAPLSKARAPDNQVQKTIIFLTDGVNTENRWTRDPTQIDQRSSQLCNQVKADKINLYTIRVIEGNESLLRSCATSTSMYYSVMQASELKGVFEKIAAEITMLRLSY